VRPSRPRPADPGGSGDSVDEEWDVGCLGDMLSMSEGRAGRGHRAAYV
jgi:hypothetical protein